MRLSAAGVKLCAAGAKMSNQAQAVIVPTMAWLSDVTQRIVEILGDPRLLIALFLFSLTLLVLPAPVTEWFGLTNIVNEGRGWISLILILSIAGLIAHAAVGGARVIQDRQAASKRVRKADAARKDLVERVIDRLDSLSDKEIAYIAAAVRDRQQTIFTRLLEPVASSLVDKGFLKPGSGGVPLRFPYHFHDDIWDLMVENRDLILAEQERRAGRR